MENDMITVESASDWTLVVNVPDLNLHKVWSKRGAKYPIPRNVMFQAYYNPAVEALFRDGMLVTDDKEFMISVGLMTDEGETSFVHLTDKLLARMIKLLPISELKDTMKQMSSSQLEEFANYAILHNSDLAMDRVDLISKATGVDILTAIRNYKKSMED